VRPIEPAPEPLERFLEPPADRARRNAESARDLRRRESLRVAEQDRRAERLLELADQSRDHLLQLVAREQLFTRRRGALTECSHGLLACRAVRVASPAKPRGVPHHARQPRPYRPREVRRSVQRRDPRVLRDIIGHRTIADQPGREAPQPGRVFQQHLGGAHGLFMQRGHERWPE